ncbi:DUF1572 family protein [Lutibacter flavus]|uniref:DUF1572 domain-containing protein n=1 Tax=Lutibacter flavus TaxID=691689 RepID=A0A238VDL8_9FLAO|nr:DUF1572 family protein [Lutibacter flavus]SNR32346.1 Protein of unknown function [Lutibacter flavus]
MEANYLESAKKQFEYYKMLGEKTFSQLDEMELFWQYNLDSNSIDIIVNHLWGNMKSRWTDFLTTDGEKNWRKRDQEFEYVIKSKSEFIKKWNDGWECLFTALDSINKDNFNTKVYIRNERHTVVEAINRQLAHYAFHIGQIVYIGRIIKADKWKNLSIPKGKSLEFNEEKFAAQKTIKVSSNALRA